MAIYKNENGRAVQYSGSGGGGGHTIYNESGTAMTQRAGLQFEGATITDDETNDVTIVTIEGGGTTIVQKPTVTVGTYTYDGTAQGPSITGLDTEHCTVTNATKTDAGTYTLTIALKNTAKMVWSDMTTTDLTYSYTINKATVTVPTVTGTNLTYNGSAQHPTVTGYDDTLMTRTGYEYTNAGSYTLTFGLVDDNNYQYDDVASFAWEIAKANQTLSASPSSVTLDSTHLSASVTISGAVNTLSIATGYDATVVNPSLSGSTLTIGNVNQKSGNTSVVITAAGSENYNEGSVSVSVAANFLAIVSFAEGTDEQIAAMLDAYYNDQITWTEMGWAVGNTRKIHLNQMTAPNPYSGNWDAQDITVVIVAHDHTDLATPINEHTKACITVQTRECMNNESVQYHSNTNTLNGHIYVNGDSAKDMSFTKWSSLYMRTYMNSTVLGAFSYSKDSSGTAIGSGTSFKNIIKQSKHYRHTTYNGTESEQVTDTLFLPSYPEIFGTASYSNYVVTNPIEGTQFDYYATSANRVKQGNNNGVANGTTQYWWEGSASSGYSSSGGYSWCGVNTGGSAHYTGGNNAGGLAPAFAM